MRPGRSMHSSKVTLKNGRSLIEIELPRDRIEHAALIIAFHRYYRHNVRYPDPERAATYREMTEFVDSGPGKLSELMSGWSPPTGGSR